MTISILNYNGFSQRNKMKKVIQRTEMINLRIKIDNSNRRKITKKKMEFENKHSKSHKSKNIFTTGVVCSSKNKDEQVKTKNYNNILKIKTNSANK